MRNTPRIKPKTATLSVLLIGAVLTGCASNTPKNVHVLPNNIEYPFQDLRPGYSYLQEISGPGVTREITWVFAGKEHGLYRWNLFLKDNVDGAPSEVQWLNERGALVKYLKSDKQVKWEPHNCFRVIGSCEFTFTDPYGYENNYIREGSFDGRSWTYQLYRIEPENRDLITNGEVRFSNSGIEIFHEYFTKNNGHQISKVTEFF